MNDESNEENPQDAEHKDRRKDQPATKDPDIHLDVPQLKADEIRLNLLGLLDADVQGLDAELLLEADLDNLVDLLRRVVEALDEEESSGSGLSDTLGKLLGSAARRASGKDGGTDEEVGQALDTLRSKLGSESGGKTNGSSSEVNDGGQSVSHTVAGNGDILKATLNEYGEVLDEEIVGNVSDLPGS